MSYSARLRIPRKVGRAAWPVLLVLIVTLSACRDKSSTVIGPGPGPTSGWMITLEDKSVLYSPPLDTIKVRFTKSDGSPDVGKRLTFKAAFDSVQITHFAYSRDNVWGCEPLLQYWGNGSDDQDNPVETIYAFYIDTTTHDTLAQTSRSYSVRPR